MCMIAANFQWTHSPSLNIVMAIITLFIINQVCLMSPHSRGAADTACRNTCCRQQTHGTTSRIQGLLGHSGHVEYLCHRVCLHIIHTHTFNGFFSGNIQVSWHQIGETNLDCTEARDGEWQWHQLGHMQVCTSLQTDNHASTPPLSFLQVGCPSCRPTNSVKAVKGLHTQ